MSDTDDETFCSLCGHLLTKREIATRVEGVFIDFENRDEGDTTLIFCSECWSKIRQVTKGGIARARAQWRELHLLREDSKIRSILDREGINGGREGGECE